MPEVRYLCIFNTNSKCMCMMIKFKLIPIIFPVYTVRTETERCTLISFSVFCFLVSAWLHLSFA